MVQYTTQSDRPKRLKGSTSTWKDPHNEVWYTVQCHRCGRLIARLKLPGILRQTLYRLCDPCQAEMAPQRPRERRRRRRRRGSAQPAGEGGEE